MGSLGESMMSAHLMLLLLQDAFMRDWSKLLSKFYIVRLFTAYLSYCCGYAVVMTSKVNAPDIDDDDAVGLYNTV